MTLSDYKVTTSSLWEAALAFALIDFFFILLLMRRIHGEMFRQLRPYLVFTAGIFWFLVWLLMSAYFWDPVYHYVFPAWARWLIPPVYSILFMLATLLFWWLSFRIPGHPMLNFCILGGLWGMLSHLWGISRGLIDKPPMLQGLNPISVAVMPIFEFMFYWCIILSISHFLSKHLNSPANRLRGGLT